MSNILFSIFCATLSLPFWYIWGVLLSAPPSSFWEQSYSTLIVDRQERHITHLLSDEQEWKRFVSIESVSPHFLNAVIAAEDSNFWSHNGIDFLASMRAMRDNIIMGKIISGASTISQQVVQNVSPQPSHSISQKVNKMIGALRLEKHFSKNEILQQWINRVSFGGNIVGVESAAQHILGKSSAHLSLAESAFLAGIPQSPSRLNPFEKFERVKNRQEFILHRMEAEGFISSREKEFALTEKIQIHPTQNQNIAPHFTTFLQSQSATPHSVQEHAEETGENRRNIENLSKNTSQTLHSTLDLDLQKKTTNLVNLHLQRLSAHKINNAAVLVWDIETGDILSYVGNSDFSNTETQGQVDILTSPRAVGSTLKPFLYLLAFDELGWTPQTRILDEPQAFETATGFAYEPQNYDLEFRGQISVRQALAESRNIPAVTTLQAIGQQEFLQFLTLFGIPTDEVMPGDFGLSAALGSFDITPLNLAHAYGILARGGRDFSFQFLTDQEKNIPQKLSPASTVLSHSCSNAYHIIDILSDDTARINSFGSDTPLTFDFAVAVKTGTTRNFRDNWTVGFSDQIGVLVWVGNADGAPMHNVSGISGAGLLFHQVMEYAMRDKEKTSQFTMSEICHHSLASENTYSPPPQNSPSTSPEKETPTLESDLRLLSPLDGQQFFITPTKPLNSQKLQFRATQHAQWFVNDIKIGEGTHILWTPKNGIQEIRAKNAQGETSTTITIQ